MVCLIQQGQAQWIHCGDSRLYWLRGGRILARTIDHSHVERLISIGRLPPYESARHPDRNKLYNCLGAPTLPGIDRSGAVPLRAGDQLLLCSDGLWNSIPEHQLAYRLSVSPLEQAVPEMVSSAVIAGGKSGDNVTVLAFTWLDSGDSGAHASDSALLTDGMPHDRVITSIQSASPGATGSGSDGALAEIERALARMRLD